MSAVALSPTEAIDELAKVLYAKLEHVDPSDDFVAWPDLNEHERECYRDCVKAILWRGSLIDVAVHYCKRPATT
jgi:hypothetical protein